MSDPTPSQAPYIFQQRGVDTDLSLPASTVGIYEAPDPRYRSDDFDPDCSLRRRAIYTDEGFVPPVDSTFARDFCQAKSDGEELPPPVEMFSSSMTAVIKSPSEVADELPISQVASVWETKPLESYEATQRCTDSYSGEIPIYLPDLGTWELGQYLSIAAIACAKYIEDDEPVNNYTLGQKVAEVYHTELEVGIIAAEMAISGDAMPDGE